MQPIEKAAHRIGLTLEKTFYRLEKEGERILELVSPPLKKLANQSEILLKKLMSPLRKIKNFIERRAIVLQKLIGRIPFEAFARPFRSVYNSVVSPLAQSLIKMSGPLQTVGKQLYQGGKRAYDFIFAITRRGARKFNSLLDRMLIKLSNFLIKLFKIIVGMLYRFYRFVLKFPQMIGRAILHTLMAPYHAFAKLTVIARSWVS